MKKAVKIKWALIAGSLLFMALITNAQPGDGRGPHHGNHGHDRPDSCQMKCKIDKIVKDLSMNEEQKQKFIEIHNAHLEKMKAVRQQDSICMAQNREKHMQMREEMDKEVKQILTPEQVAKYDSIMAEKRGPHHGKRCK